jgi:hypothetical protein
LGEVLVAEMGRPEKVLAARKERGEPYGRGAGGEKGKGREQRSGYWQKIGQP